MRSKWPHLLALLAIAGCLLGQQQKSQPKSQPKSQTQPDTAASGVFLGRSGAPMAGARLILCEARGDTGKIKLLNVPTATVDNQGRFTLRGVPPGRWTIIYLPSGVNAAVPNEIDITALEAVDKSIAPLLVRTELGTTEPYAPRQWGPQFTLLKGHTLWSMGAQMKVWNSTVRRGRQGPFFEVRRGGVWLQDMNDKTEIKFTAWGY